MLSFSVVAESTVPPTFAIAAAVTFASTSPVSGVSRVCCAPFDVVVDASVACLVSAPKASVAPPRAHAASSAAPAGIFHGVRVIRVLSSAIGMRSPRDHAHLRAA